MVIRHMLRQAAFVSFLPLNELTVLCLREIGQSRAFYHVSGAVNLAAGRPQNFGGMNVAPMLRQYVENVAHLT